MHPCALMTHELNVFDVSRIAREAALEQSLPVDVIGVVPGRGGEYAEVLFYMDGWPSECQVEMGVFRNASEPVLRQAIAARLREHIEERTSAS